MHGAAFFVKIILVFMFHLHIFPSKLLTGYRKTIEFRNNNKKRRRKNEQNLGTASIYLNFSILNP